MPTQLWSRPWPWAMTAVVGTPVVVAALLAAPGLTLVAVLAVAVVVVGLQRPWLLVVALVVFLPFNGVASQLLGNTSTATAVGAIKDLLLALLLCTVVAGRRRASVPGWLVGPVVALLVLPLLFAVLTAERLDQALYGWRTDYYPLLFLLVVPAVLGPLERRRVTTAIAVMAQVVGVVGLVTWTRGIDWLIFLKILPPVDQFPFQFFTAGSSTPRAFSPYSAPNEMGVALAVSLAVIWAREDWSTRRQLLLTVLPLVGLLLTQSRSGLLGAAAVLLLLYLRRSRRIAGAGIALATGALVLAATAGGALIFFFTSGDLTDPSAVAHAASLRESFWLPVTHPLGLGLGEVGPRAVHFTQNPVLVESFWLLIGIEAGILVLAAYLAVLAMVARRALTSPTPLGYLGATALAASLPSQILLPAMQEGAVSYLVWIAVGCGVAACEEARTVPQPTPVEVRA